MSIRPITDLFVTLGILVIISAFLVLFNPII